jgi:hypothetical protein
MLNLNPFRSGTGMLGSTETGQAVTPENLHLLPVGSVARLGDGGRLIRLHDDLWLWLSDSGCSHCYDMTEHMRCRVVKGSVACHVAPPPLSDPVRLPLTSEIPVSYARVPSSTQIKRSFAITLGLVEGYGKTGKTHTRDEVCLEVASYLRRHAQSTSPFLSGVVSSVGDVVYAYTDGAGNAHGCHEPVITYSGDVSVLYAADLVDVEIADMLNDMAGHLGGFLGQTRVYVSFRDLAWVLQREDKTTPTGD